MNHCTVTRPKHSISFLSASRICLVFSTLVASTAHSAPAPAEASITTDRLGGFTRTLEDAGYENGITFDGAESTHEITLSYPIPRDTNMGDASVYLRYQASPLLNKLANLRVLANEQPIRHIRLESDDNIHGLRATIPSKLLRKGSLNLTIKAALPVSDDRCLDARVDGSLLHLLPESSVSIPRTGAIGSLRDAWSLLPETVVVSLPDRALTESEYTAAWTVLDGLIRQGNQVSVVTFPRIGHIAIARHNEIETVLRNELLISKHPDATEYRLGFGAQDANIALLHSPERSLIAISEPYDSAVTQLLEGNWLKLGAANRYRTYSVDYAENVSGLALPPKDDEALEILLEDLGVNIRTRHIRTQVQWDILLDPHKLPAGTRPDMLFLNLIAAAPANKPPFEMYVYLNDIMIQASRLETHGGQQEITVPLPRQYQEPYNRISVQILHSEPTGNCEADLTAYPIQIMPDSRLVLQQDHAEPKRFSDLPMYMSGEFDYYLPHSYLSSASESLPFIAQFSARLPVQSRQRTILFSTNGASLSPQRPFIAIGDLNFSQLDAPVRFDKGHVTVVDKNGDNLLDVSALPGITIAQLISSNDQHGLWLRAQSDQHFPVIASLFLNVDNIAFADKDGLLFSMDSSQPTLARVHYPDSRDWFAILGEYRFWLLAFAWLALTLGIIYLFRQSRQHRRNSEQ